MADNDYITIPRAQIRFSSPHANIDKEWGPYNSVDSALQAMPNLNVRKAGKKFGVVSTVGGVTTVEEYMFTKDNATDNDIVKLVLSSDDVTGTFDYTIGSTTSEQLSEAIGANKIITIGTYIASVGRVGTSSSGYYVVCYTDEDGVFHKIVHGTSTSSVGTETTKEFAEVETVNSTSELGLSGVIGGIKKYQGNTMLDLGGVSGSGTLGNVIKNLISLGTHVDADDTNNVFAIKNINNDAVGTITLSTAASGAAVLTFADNANGSFTATLPNLRYDSTTQMLKMVDAGENETNLIKLSNLQIKTVFDYNTYEGDAPTSVAQDAYAIGDLALVEKQDTTTTPATVYYDLAVVQSVTAGTPNDTIQWQPLGSINNVSLVADQVEFDNSTNGFSANNVQRAIEEVAANLEGIEKDYSLTEDDDSIEIEDEQGNKVVEITPNGVDAKNLKSNGKNVATEDELELLATKEEVEGKQDEIEGIEQTEEAIQIPTIEFRDDEDNYVGEVSSQAIAAKKFLIKQNPNDEGVDIASVIGGTSIAKQLGLSDIIHVIGYGQSLMAGSSSGTPVTTTQNRSNLFRFEGGVRPYDVFDLDTNKRVAIKRQNGVNPSYLEMSDNKSNCLEQSDITKINTSIGSLIPLTEQRINYAKNQDDTYSPTNSGGTYDARHADGETPLSGFCEGFLSNLEKTYGNNFGFDMLATCCAYGSADFPSLLPFDREGRTHNPSISDGSNMNYFEVLLMSVKGAKAIADAQNKSYSVDVVVYMESATQTPNISGVTVTNAMRAYRIAQLFTLINQRVKAITKQSNDILFLCDQSKTYDTQREALRILAVDKEISLTQAEKSALDTLNDCYIEPYDMSKIYLVTSANNYPIRKGYDPNDNGGDRIHHPSQVQKQKGATIGNAYADILTGKGFSPLSPIGIQVIGNDIYIKYHVPVSPIVIDTDAINGYQNHPTYMNGYGKYGFGISNGADNPTYYDIINTVEVVESDTIKISCSDSLSGKTLEYCYRSMANNADGATGPTNSEFGNIRDSQGDVKKITIGNTDYPLHNWGIGFSKQL